MLNLTLVYADGSRSHRARMKFACSPEKTFGGLKEQLGLPKAVLLTIAQVCASMSDTRPRLLI